LYKDFTPSGPLQDILKACQNPNHNLRPSSLDVLENVHRHVSDPFQSLENELGHKPGGFILQAFLRIAKNLDVTTFGTQTSIMQRKRLLARLELLLKDGAEVPFQEHSRSLHLAILLDKDRMLKTLLSKGQNPDETWQNSGWTPLHLAAQQGNTEMAEELLEANADPATVDRHGYKAVDYASNLGHPDIVELFVESTKFEIQDPSDPRVLGTGIYK
jgi:Ankyrin repeats (3 copies)